VRSFSDTESARSQRPNKRPSTSHSDTEVATKTPPAIHNDSNRCSEKIHLSEEKVNGEAEAEVEIAEKKVNGEEAKATAATDGSKKWNGSLNTKPDKTDTVKELLKMSHSGYSEQVRTWDGGKSHVTKAVEDLKRAQRKRTYDELLDGDMDKGKVCV